LFKGREEYFSGFFSGRIRRGGPIKPFHGREKKVGDVLNPLKEKKKPKKGGGPSVDREGKGGEGACILVQVGGGDFFWGKGGRKNESFFCKGWGRCWCGCKGRGEVEGPITGIEKNPEGDRPVWQEGKGGKKKRVLIAKRRGGKK